MIGCIALDEADGNGENVASVPNIENLFKSIDVTNRGRIDFEEFKKFYETVLIASSEMETKKVVEALIKK